MPSKLVTDAQKQTEDICAFVETHSDAITAGVKKATTTEELKHGFNVAPLLAHLATACGAALASLVKADEAHEKELADDVAPREARDEAAAKLSAELVDLKRGANGLFTAKEVRELGFPSEIPSDPAVLERVGGTVIAALTKQKALKSKLNGVGTVQLSEWVEQLKTPLDALITARGDVSREEKEARATQVARDAAFEALNEANVTTAALTQALARLGGVSNLVDGLRGTVDRSGSGAAKPAVPTDPTEPNKG